MKNYHKKHPRAFWIFMLFYVFIGMLMILFGLIGFRGFIEDYEYSLPHHTVEEFLSADDNGSRLLKGDSDFSLSEFETAEQVAEEIYFPDENTELTYKKAGGEYTEEVPVYAIQADGRNIARVTLKKSGQTTEHGFPVWEIARTDSLIEAVKTREVKILVPEGTVLKINGVTVPDSYRTGIKTDVPDLKGAYKYIEALPKLVEYKVGGLYLKPEVTAEDKSGRALASDTDGSSYSFRPTDSAELKAKHEEMILAMERAYISYMINEFKETDANFARLSQYLMTGSPAYSMFRNLSVEWNNPYDSREDILISAEKFTPYSEDCFACNTVFKIKLKRYRLENEYNGNIRWTFVKKDGQWKAVQMEFES